MVPDDAARQRGEPDWVRGKRHRQVPRSSITEHPAQRTRLCCVAAHREAMEGVERAGRPGGRVGSLAGSVMGWLPRLL